MMRILERPRYPIGFCAGAQFDGPVVFVFNIQRVFRSGVKNVWWAICRNQYPSDIYSFTASCSRVGSQRRCLEFELCGGGGVDVWRPSLLMRLFHGGKPLALFLEDHFMKDWGEIGKLRWFVVSMNQYFDPDQDAARSRFEAHDISLLGKYLPQLHAAGVFINFLTTAMANSRRTGCT